MYPSIDYVLMTEEAAQTTKYLEIDEEGTHRLKGKEDSDHNTILIETNMPTTSKYESCTVSCLGTCCYWQDIHYIIEIAKINVVCFISGIEFNSHVYVLKKQKKSVIEILLSILNLLFFNAI